jgi:hypothetical protein
LAARALGVAISTAAAGQFSVRAVFVGIGVLVLLLTAAGGWLPPSRAADIRPGPVAAIDPAADPITIDPVAIDPVAIDPVAIDPVAIDTGADAGPTEGGR